MHISNISEAKHNMKQILEDVHRWSRKFSNVTDLNCQTTKYEQADRVRLSSLKKCLRHKSNYSQCQIRNFGSIEPDLLQHKSCSVWVVSVPSCPIHYKKILPVNFFYVFPYWCWIFLTQETPRSRRSFWDSPQTDRTAFHAIYWPWKGIEER